MMPPSLSHTTPAPAPRPCTSTCATLGATPSMTSTTASDKPAKATGRANLTALANRDLHRHRLPAADDLDRHLLADALAREEAQQVVGVARRMPVQLDDHVAQQQAALRGRAVLLHVHDQEARHIRRAGQPHRLAADADVAALGRAVLAQRLGYAPGDAV